MGAAVPDGRCADSVCRVDMAKEQTGEGSKSTGALYDTKRTVFIGNLPFDVEDEDILKLFQAKGERRWRHVVATAWGGWSHAGPRHLHLLHMHDLDAASGGVALAGSGWR